MSKAAMHFKPVNKLRLLILKAEEMKIIIAKVKEDPSLPASLKQIKVTQMEGCLRDVQLMLRSLSTEYIDALSSEIKIA